MRPKLVSFIEMVDAFFVLLHNSSVYKTEGKAFCISPRKLTSFRFEYVESRIEHATSAQFCAFFGIWVKESDLQSGKAMTKVEFTRGCPYSRKKVHFSRYCAIGQGVKK